MHTARIMLRWTGILLALSANGCLLLAAGVVEANRKPLTGNTAQNDLAYETTGDAEVVGSDGSHGWRVQGDPRQLAVSLRGACSVESEAENEMRASCNNIPVMLRHDGTSVFRLCPQNVERTACAAAWQTVR